MEKKSLDVLIETCLVFCAAGTGFCEAIEKNFNN